MCPVPPITTTRIDTSRGSPGRLRLSLPVEAEPRGEAWPSLQVRSTSWGTEHGSASCGPPGVTFAAVPLAARPCLDSSRSVAYRLNPD